MIPRMLVAPRRFFCSALRLPSERAAAAAGVELPAHVVELIDSTPVSVDERIQKMLALEKWMKQTGIQLRLPRKVVWWVPELPEELEIEIENAGGPEKHEDFIGWEGSVPLFKGDAYLAFRTLRARIGSDGPPCGEEVVQDLFEQINNDDELKYVHWSIQLCRSRHLEFGSDTLDSLLGAFQRVPGNTEKLADLLRDAPSKRLFLSYDHWLQAMNTCIAESDTGSAAVVSESMAQHRKQPPSAEQAGSAVQALLQAQAWEPAARLVLALEHKFAGSVPASSTAALLQALASEEVEGLAAAEEAATAATEGGDDEDKEEGAAEHAVWTELGAFLRGIPTDALQGELGSAREAAFQRYPSSLGGLAPPGADDSAGDDGAPAATLDAEEAAEEAEKA